MTIAAYCKLHGLSAAEFGRRCGVSRAVAARWVKGEDVPRGPNIKKVVEGTRGEVTANEILGIGLLAASSSAATPPDDPPAEVTALVPIEPAPIVVEDRTPPPLDALKAVVSVVAVGVVLGLLA